MLHRPDTWTDALFIYPLYYVNFLTSFREWFRFFFFQWRDLTVKTENIPTTAKTKPKKQLSHLGPWLVPITYVSSCSRGPSPLQLLSRQ